MLNLRKYRVSAGLTQAQAASRTGVGSNTVSQWECGVRTPSVKRLCLLAELYGCSLDDFVRCEIVQ